MVQIAEISICKAPNTLMLSEFWFTVLRCFFLLISSWCGIVELFAFKDTFTLFFYDSLTRLILKDWSVSAQIMSTYWGEKTTPRRSGLCVPQRWGVWNLSDSAAVWSSLDFLDARRSRCLTSLTSLIQNGPQIFWDGQLVVFNLLFRSVAGQSIDSGSDAKE